MQKRGEIMSLTGLRGVAALLVMAYHYRNLALVDHHLQPSPIGPAYLMVDLFFILSGFVMARTYGPAFDCGFTWQAYATFLKARVARIYPLYVIITLAVFCLTLLLTLDYPTRPIRALLTNVLMLQNLGVGFACQGCSEKLVLPSWSISTEAAAYILFPIMAAAALFGSRYRAAAFTAACVTVLLVVSSVPLAWLRVTERHGPLDISEGVTLWPLLRCLAEFGLGLLLWRVARTGFAVPPKLDLAADLLLAGAIAVLWMAPGADLALVALLAALLLHLATDRSPLARLLGASAPHAAGAWSYAIYLLHRPVLIVFPAVLPLLKAAHVPHAWSLGLALLSVWTICLAALAHRFIEKPARALIAGLSNRPSRARIERSGSISLSTNPLGVEGSNNSGGV